jgi:hypothetical protein
METLLEDVHMNFYTPILTLRALPLLEIYLVLVRIRHMARTPWHPAVVQAFENELEEWREDLAIEAEHHLITGPLRIDVLIIKKRLDVDLNKNIAQIFMQCNIIEFKGPGVSATVEGYNKTHSYARLYASKNEVDIVDLSVTIMATSHPRDLLTFLKKRFKVRHEQQGIYIVEGEVYPTQVIATSELPKDENFWLANLRNDLTKEQMERVLAVLVDKPGSGAYLYAVSNANPKTLEELYMEGIILTEKLDAYFTEKYSAPWIAEGIEIGEAKGIEIGEARGEAKRDVEIARNMKRKGYSTDDIADLTGLSSGEIERL